MQIPPHTSATLGPLPKNGDAAPSRWSQLFGEEGLSFRDVLDLVNPLQHIPLVGNLYRKLTGDTIDPAIRVAGGALFGGPLGAVLSLGSMVVEQGRKVEAASPVSEESPSAVVVTAQPYRGGWMVNAAMTGQLPQLATSPLPATEAVSNSAKVAETTHPEIRRGGWLVAQAYALNDLQPAASNGATARIEDEV